MHVPCRFAPQGWTVFEPLVDPYVYDFFKPTFSRGCGPSVSYPNEHQSDVVARKASEYIMWVRHLGSSSQLAVHGWPAGRCCGSPEG